MRTKTGEKEKLRAKILEEAAAYIKETGKDRAPVDKIMERVGLTSGALYSHFGSKESLFTETVLAELDRITARHAAAIEAEGPKAIEALIRSYLSPAHIDASGEGCIFVALGADMARADAETKERFRVKLDRLFVAIGEGIPGKSAAERRAKAEFLFSSMIGALTLARCGRVEAISSTLDALLKYTQRDSL